MADEYYAQELRQTSTPGEYQMFYIKKVLTPAEKAEIEATKTANQQLENSK